MEESSCLMRPHPLLSSPFLVGFTDISGKLSAMKVQDMLHRLYQRFDVLSHKHDVFKIETIVSAQRLL